MLSVHQQAQTQQPKSKNYNYKDGYHFGGRLFCVNLFKIVELALRLW